LEFSWQLYAVKSYVKVQLTFLSQYVLPPSSGREVVIDVDTECVHTRRIFCRLSHSGANGCPVPTQTAETVCGIRQPVDTSGYRE
jgi:hypothetical protein